MQRLLWGCSHSLLVLCAVIVSVEGSFVGTATAGPSSVRRRRRSWSHHPDQAARAPASSPNSRSPTASTANADIYQQQQQPVPSSVKWEVYVDQSKASLDRGGGATLDAFVALAPPNEVVVHPALLDPPRSSSSGSSSSSSSSSSKLKGPVVRCLATTGAATKSRSFDVANVDSVDKVLRILQKHMRVSSSNTQTMSECLKWKYKGNGDLEAGRVAAAIAAYDQALALLVEKDDNDDPGRRRQEGTVRLMRATAYLQRAAAHREILKPMVRDLTQPQHAAATALRAAASTAGHGHAVLALPLLRRVLQQTATGERQFRQTQYRHGLYQYALLQAAQDALRATALLPDYADSWRRAAEILSELWKLRESAQYFQRAVELDAALAAPLGPVLERLERRRELLQSARAYGWSEDSLRLALDVAR